MANQWMDFTKIRSSHGGSNLLLVDVFIAVLTFQCAHPIWQQYDRMKQWSLDHLAYWNWQIWFHPYGPIWSIIFHCIHGNEIFVCRSPVTWLSLNRRQYPKASLYDPYCQWPERCFADWMPNTPKWMIWKHDKVVRRCVSMVIHLRFRLYGHEAYGSRFHGRYSKYRLFYRMNQWLSYHWTPQGDWSWSSLFYSTYPYGLLKAIA